MKDKIIEILQSHSSGCKELELVADLTIALFADGLMAGSGEPFDMEAFNKALDELVIVDQIRVVLYTHDMGGGHLRAKRFIFLT